MTRMTQNRGATIVLPLGAGTALAIGWHSGPAALRWRRSQSLRRIVGSLVAIAAAGPGLFTPKPWEHSP